jgi:hypothetical protein
MDMELILPLVSYSALPFDASDLQDPSITGSVHHLQDTVSQMRRLLGRFATEAMNLHPQHISLHDFCEYESSEEVMEPLLIQSARLGDVNAVTSLLRAGECPFVQSADPQTGECLAALSVTSSSK